MPAIKLLIFYQGLGQMEKNKAIKTLVLCLADPATNPRPKRIIGLCLSMGHRVSVASFSTADSQKFSAHYLFRLPSMTLQARIGRKFLGVFAPASFQARMKAKRWGLQSVAKELEHEDFDIIIVEDFNLLPFAFSLNKSAKIIFDAREYYPGEFENNWWFMRFERPERMSICQKYLSKCAAVLTVSPGLARRYKQECNIDPVLFRSTPDFCDVNVRPVDFSNVRMVHHGVANRDRKLENMIDMFSFLDDRFSLDFYLNGSHSYRDELMKRARGNPKIRFLQPVPFSGIIPMLQNYDIGLYLLEPTGFNTEYALPNKFFEFIQARLMLAIGPSPDMADLSRQYQCGVVADTFKPQAMAALLNALTHEDIESKKAASDKAAMDLNFEKESQKFINLVSSLLNDAGGHSKCA